MSSNGYLVTDVIQFTRKFGQCKDHETEEPLLIESCDYIEAVKLTGDPDVPAGKASIIIFSLYDQMSLFAYCKVSCVRLLNISTM